MLTWVPKTSTNVAFLVTHSFSLWKCVICVCEIGCKGTAVQPLYKLHHGRVGMKCEWRKVLSWIPTEVCLLYVVLVTWKSINCRWLGVVFPFCVPLPFHLHRGHSLVFPTSGLDSRRQGSVRPDAADIIQPSPLLQLVRFSLSFYFGNLPIHRVERTVC